MSNLTTKQLSPVCTKCGGTRFNTPWNRCMDCRNARAVKRKQKMEANGGSHTSSQWQALLSKSPKCPACARLWSEVPTRPDTRYKYVWTKGHTRPVYHGGSDDISNIQAECYQCNFKKNAGSLKRDTV